MSIPGSGLLTPSEGSVIRAEVSVPGLYVKRIWFGADGEGSGAILGSKPQDEDGNDIRFEQVGSLVDACAQVSISVGGITVLHGRILTAQIRAQGRDEEIEYTVLGLEWELMTEKVYGSWCKDNDDKATRFDGIPCVFNPEGKKNMHKEDLEDAETSGQPRICFNLDTAPENEDARLWDAGKMVRYVATAERKGDLTVGGTRVFETSATPGGELSDFEPFDVNVDGEDIWGALIRIARLCSHSVVVQYATLRDECTLRFFPRKVDGASAKQFEFPAAGGVAEISDRGAVLASLDIQRDWAGVVNRVDVVAPPKLYEYEFEMIPGWKQEDEDAAFGEGATEVKIANFLKETDPEASSDWDRFKNVGRRYILNETGRDDVKEEEPEPFDFGEIFEGEAYAERNRPFRRRIVSKEEDSGAEKPIEVTVQWGGSISDNVNIGAHVTVLEDRAGVYFRGRPLVAVERAMDANDVQDLFPELVKVKAVVECDTAHPTPVFATDKNLPIRTFDVIRLDDGFRTNNVDDSEEIEEKAQALADEALEATKDAREVGTVVCPYITNQFQVGDVIDRISGRDLPVRAIIAKMCWDFMSQSTEFALEIPGLDTETHSRERENLAGAGVDATTDNEMRQVRELLYHKHVLGHPVDDMLRAAIVGAGMGNR